MEFSRTVTKRDFAKMDADKPPLMPSRRSARIANRRSKEPSGKDKTWASSCPCDITEEDRPRQGAERTGHDILDVGDDHESDGEVVDRILSDIAEEVMN